MWEDRLGSAGCSGCSALKRRVTGPFGARCARVRHSRNHEPDCDPHRGQARWLPKENFALGNAWELWRLLHDRADGMMLGKGRQRSLVMFFSLLFGTIHSLTPGLSRCLVKAHERQHFSVGTCLAKDLFEVECGTTLVVITAIIYPIAVPE